MFYFTHLFPPNQYYKHLKYGLETLKKLHPTLAFAAQYRVIKVDVKDNETRCSFVFYCITTQNSGAANIKVKLILMLL